MDVIVTPQYLKPWALSRTFFEHGSAHYFETLEGPGHIEVIVEAKRQRRFFVPEKRLCEKSQFFSAALRGCFREAYEKKVQLPEEDPDLFRFWLTLDEDRYRLFGNQSI